MSLYTCTEVITPAAHAQGHPPLHLQSAAGRTQMQQASNLTNAGHARPLRQPGRLPGRCTPRHASVCRVWPFSSNSPQEDTTQLAEQELERMRYLQQQRALEQQQQDAAAPSRPVQNNPQQQSQQQQQQDELLRTSPKWRWLEGNAAQQQQSQQSNPTQQRRQQQQQQGEQLSPQQQAALRDMILDATVNPKWRWPSFGGTSPDQLQQQQQDEGGWGPPPPPPPPPSASWPPYMPPNTQQQQQQGWGGPQNPRSQGISGGATRVPPPPPPPPPPVAGGYPPQAFQDTQQQQQQRQGGWWPFGGAGGLSGEDEEYRQQLEALGVDLVGSRGRKQQQQQPPGRGKKSGDVDFEQMDDRQIAAYMNRMRQSRLERLTNRQDDEVVGIVGLYLGITAGILALAALANLPS